MEYDELDAALVQAPAPCQNHSQPRAIASHIRPGERAHPESAYVGTKAHARAINAKPEPQVLASFLVFKPPHMHIIYSRIY
jgi:hypothetical protein